MEAAILQFFENIRNPFFDVFFGLFSLLGEAMIVGGLAILLFWLLPKREGEQLIMTALTSFPLNSFLKFLVARPRPYIAGVVEYRAPFFGDELDPYASFPSGHTQSSSSLLLPFADSFRKKCARVLSFCLAGFAILMVMLARMYFGAHYPTDVLAGLALGLAVSLFWGIIFRFAFSARYFILFGFALLAALPCLFGPPHDYFQAFGLIAGAAVSLGVRHILVADKSFVPFPRRLWRVPAGAVLVGAVFALTLLFPAGDGFSLLKWFLVAMAAGFAPCAFDLLKI